MYNPSSLNAEEFICHDEALASIAYASENRNNLGEKIFLKAGESKTVSFKITPELLHFYDYDLNYVAEPGDFDVMIGGNSQHVKTARLSLK